jgi:hypothetical protein
MPLQIQGNGGVTADVGGTAFRALNTQIKPIEYGALGHYRTSVAITSTSVQAANSRIFEIRNTGTNLLVLTRLVLSVLQTAAGTAQLNSLQCFRCTSFTAVDTTNTVTPVSSVRRTSMAAYPGNAAIRHLTLSGNASGMTGGTLTKDTQAFGILPFNVATAASTSTLWGPKDIVDDVNGTHPFVFAQNEGFEIESTTLNVTSFGVTWYIDCAWAEVAAY